VQGDFESGLQATAKKSIGTRRRDGRRIGSRAGELQTSKTNKQNYCQATLIRNSSCILTAKLLGSQRLRAASGKQEQY
jgi:hypothetical protein